MLTGWTGRTGLKRKQKKKCHARRTEAYQPFCVRYHGTRFLFKNSANFFFCCLCWREPAWVLTLQPSRSDWSLKSRTDGSVKGSCMTSQLPITCDGHGPPPTDPPPGTCCYILRACLACANGNTPVSLCRNDLTPISLIKRHIWAPEYVRLSPPRRPMKEVFRRLIGK